MAHQDNSTEADNKLPAIPMVNGLECPACGHPTLILGSGGYITCSYIDCPNPDYAESVESELQAQVAEAEDRGFKEGQRVGQYQAADRLYGYVTAMYTFPGNKKIFTTQLHDMLKKCEKFMNHNVRVYYAYVRGERYKRLHPNQHKEE